MESNAFLIGVTLPAGLTRPAVRLWAVRSRQCNDPEGGSRRISKMEFDDRPQWPDHPGTNRSRTGGAAFSWPGGKGR